jgi:hypothetical protein
MAVSVKGKGERQYDPNNGAAPGFPLTKEAREPGFPGAPSVDTPPSGTGCDQPQKREAKNHGFFPAIADREQSTSRPLIEISDRHLTAQKECRQTRQQTQRD